MNYSQMEIVPKEFCLGLNDGDLFVFDKELPLKEGNQKHQIGQIIYVKHLDPKEYGLIEYWPEYTPVAHCSMVKLHAIEKIEDVGYYKILYLKEEKHENI